MNKISVQIKYKAGGLNWVNQEDLTTFENSIRQNYISNIRRTGGPQAGGCFDTFVEILMDISFWEYCKLMRDGLIFDTITRGKESFILKPLFEAFIKLESKNDAWDYTKIKFLFEDTEIVIYGMSNLFTSKIGKVFNELGNCYYDLEDKKLGKPFQILIPISNEINEEGENIFSFHGGGMDFETDDYKKYWGILYNYGRDPKIYDVENRVMLNEIWTR